MHKILCCMSGNLNGEEMKLSWAAKRNNEINDLLRKEKRRLRDRKMILMLGTGESGKSTFLKQMKIINGKKFTHQELFSFKDTIYDNIYKGILFLIRAREDLGIAWAEGSACDMAAAESSAYIEEHYAATNKERRGRVRLGQLAWTEEEFLHLSHHYARIWLSPAIKEAFAQRTRLITENFSENTRYYLNKLHYISVKDYRPTEEDIVWSRKPTECIIEEEIALHGTSIVFIDVGGQTKERRKWCQCFTDMTSVLFLIACSHFDEHYCDRVTKQQRNKLYEAMVVFGGLINHQAFRKVSIILFFNKYDILKEKIESRRSNIRNEFPSFDRKYDPHNLNDIQTFIVDSFARLVDPAPAPPTTPYVPPQHQTQAVAADNEGTPNFHRASTPNVQSAGHLTNAFVYPPPTSGSTTLPRKRPSNAVSRATANNAYVRRTSSALNPSILGVNLSSAQQPRKRMIYKHFTTAVDRRNIETVFNAMQDTVLQNNIQKIMMT